MNNDNGKLYFDAGIDVESLKSDIAEIKSSLSGVARHAENEGGKIDSAFKNIGKTVVGVFSVQQAMSFARQIVSVRGEIEALEKSFKILAGNEAGGKLFEQIKDFAIKTPMAMQELAKGAQTMLAFNLNANEVMPVLKAIGDISLGDAQKFNSLTLAFSQMSSTGKLMGQDLLQMINAGFNPLSVIATQTGKSIGELKEEMEAGAISADMIKKAFMDATAEGGKFHGMLEIQSKGIKGSISNLEGAIEDMLNSIGENYQDVITGSIQGAQKLAENYEEVGRTILELIATVGVYKTALISLNAIKAASAMATKGWTKAEILHFGALNIVEKAQKALNATILKNPYVIAAAAVASLAFGIYKLATFQSDSEKAQKKLNESVREYNKEVGKEYAQIDYLFSRLKSAKEGTDEYKTAKQAIINQYGDYLSGLQKEVQNLEDVEGAYKAIKTAAEEAARARAMEASTRDAADTLAEKQARAKDNIYKALQKEFGEQTGKDGRRLAETYYWDIISKYENGQPIDPKLLERFNKTQYIQAGSTYGGTTTQTYTTNVLKDNLDEMKKANEIYNKTVDDANRLFGGVKLDNNNNDTETVEKPPVKNKKYWEDYKKEQQGLLDAMSSAELSSKEALKIKERIAEADRNIALFDVDRQTREGDKAEKKENTVAIEKAERDDKILKYNADLARQSRQSALDIRQAEIDGMQEGFEKEIAQNQLNYDRLKEVNLTRTEDMVEALRDKKELEWQNANPDYKEKGMTFDRSTITEKDLSEEQKNIIKENARVAEELYQKANKDSLDKMLKDILTYEQTRLNVAEDFARRRQALFTDDEYGNKVFRSGVTQENLDNLNEQEKTALSEVDEVFASKEQQFKEWCELIADMSLDELKSNLAKAESEIEKLSKGDPNNPKLARARASAQKLKKEIEKRDAEKDAKNEASPKKRSIEEWNALRDAIEDCKDSFEEIGKTIGGVTGEILSQTGSIMSSTLSMINGIVQLVNDSSEAVQVTSSTAATAIATVEKASVILAVISAALQIAMKIASLFNNDKENKQEIEALQWRIDQLQWELDHVEVSRINREDEDTLLKLEKVSEETRVEIFKLRLAVGETEGAFKAVFNSLGDDTETLRKSAEKVAFAYSNIAYSADKAFGDEKYKSEVDKLKNLASQQLLIQEQIEAERNNKDSDADAIADMKRKIEELGYEAVKIINEITEDIIGGTSSEIANELADAFFSAFEAGENAAEAWGDKVKEIVSDVVKRMLISKFLEEPLGELFNKYKEKWFKDGKFSGLDSVITSMSDFANDLNNIGKDFSQIWETLPDSVKGMFNVADDAREASSKGIATASQESVDELNGRATAIQGHTYSISENMKQLVSQSAGILESVQNIEKHTEEISKRINTIETRLSDVRDSVNDIIIKGIKIH